MPTCLQNPGFEDLNGENYIQSNTADYFNFGVHEYNKESSDPKEVIWVQKNM